eukprot:1196349-Prorocentrum_minimum.AAC.4
MKTLGHSTFLPLELHIEEADFAANLTNSASLLALGVSVSSVDVAFVSDAFKVPDPSPASSRVYSYNPNTNATNAPCANNLACVKPDYHAIDNPNRAGDTVYFLLQQVRYAFVTRCAVAG